MTSFADTVKQTLLKYSEQKVTDKADYHAYEFVYPELLEYLNGKENLNILEIGVSKGGSMRCWMDIFPNATFYGIDYNLSICAEDIRNHPRVNLVEMSQSDERVKTLFPDVRFDLIIDDASHKVDDQVTTFEMLTGRLSDIGKYVIEDIYPEHQYASEFYNKFTDIDITHLKNRGDDRMFVFPKLSNALLHAKK